MVTGEDQTGEGQAPTQQEANTRMSIHSFNKCFRGLTRCRDGCGHEGTVWNETGAVLHHNVYVMMRRGTDSEKSKQINLSCDKGWQEF